MNRDIICMITEQKKGEKEEKKRGRMSHIYIHVYKIYKVFVYY